MLDKLKKIDWVIVAILLIFSGVSTALIHSAIVSAGPGYAGYEVKNIIFYGVGLIALFCTAFIDYRLLLKGAPIWYAISIALVIAVYLFGVEINGAKGWFKLPFGDLLFQPAELMKLTLIIMVAYMIHRRKGEPLGLIRDLLPIGLIGVVPFALVLIQPDLGNAIIYLVILVGMLWIGNVRYSIVLIGAVLFAAVVAGSLYLYTTYHDEIAVFLKEHGGAHWMSRIDTFLDPDSVSDDERYQVENSQIAIGSGGLYGTGYLAGDWSKKGFVPFTYSDSIFIVVGEEFGFVGASALLLLYFLLLYRMILIAIQSDHRGGSYIIIGIVSMFVFQIFENIGMFLGLMPLTGITLPFISYGGTSLLINMLSVGLAISVRINREKASMFKATE
ncbi:rod shape-determining protein RodA [Xylanibacillus composti]|uniref:Rod shape-determining protein RodA n=1 Tax=Xylanibacillus composti TaxID=1572762 RepID=A0A8J4H5Z0_9BACL|nr:FtsW/RodA/SpoVE family cell cycle protein [Xylanibacillus composti]GIQ70171.1 rod shape-determining protein RodA [Xylanibacillus composti]